MEPKSPCRKPECLKKSKLKCSEDCEELKMYQLYLKFEEQQDSAPGIDYSDTSRMVVHTIEAQTVYRD